MSRDLGAWILPQPKAKKKYVKIPKLQTHRLTIPFGYEQDEDPDWLKPIPSQLEALDLAKQHLKKYPYKAVAAWLTTQTGRKISENGLRNRVRNDRSYKRKAALYRTIAERYYKALQRAKVYESFLDREEQVSFFEEDFYVSLVRDREHDARNCDTGDGGTREGGVQAQSGASDSVSGGSGT